MTSEQAAYVAAAIDGEGHIGITRRAAGFVEWQRTTKFRFNIAIANTNKAWLEELQRWCGGTINCTHGPTERKRACYVLRFAAPESKTLLAHVMPYLLMKRRQAELALKYFEVAATRRLFSVNAKPTDPAIVAELDALCDEMRSLNLHRKVQSKPVGRKKDRRCSLDGCDSQHYGKGYCWIHYRKYIVRGGPASYDKLCVVCGTEFVTRRSNAECCSRKCSERRYYQMNAERLKQKVKLNRQRRKALAVEKR